MLAYGLDLQIGIDVGLTILSAALAVVFTFCALASDLLHDRYSKNARKPKLNARRMVKPQDTITSKFYSASGVIDESSEPLLRRSEGSYASERGEGSEPHRNSSFPQRPATIENQSHANATTHPQNGINSIERFGSTNDTQPLAAPSFGQTMFAEAVSGHNVQLAQQQYATNSEVESEGELDGESYQDTLSQTDDSRRSSSFGESSRASLALGGILSLKKYKKDPNAPTNPFVAAYKALYTGINTRNIVKGFFWAIAITSMHYVGIRALKVPNGHVLLDPYLVLLSGLICWVVCVVGCVLILELETNLGQQLLFSAVATCGVATMRTYSCFYHRFEERD